MSRPQDRADIDQLEVHLGRHQEPKLPIQPLLDATRETHRVQQAKKLRVHRRQLYRWIAGGISVTNADELAMRLNRHPSEIWDDWYGDDELLGETG